MAKQDKIHYHSLPKCEVTVVEKFCSICELTLPRSKFSSNKGNRRDGLQSQCTECKMDIQKGRIDGKYNKKPDVCLCAICHKLISGPEIHKDHDHSNGLCRDALCTDCNLGLGRFLDSPVLLFRAAKYLIHWATVHTLRLLLYKQFGYKLHPLKNFNKTPSDEPDLV